MEAYTGLIIIAVLYGILLFFDNFFKTCMHYPYYKFLEGTGFTIKPFQIRWCTKAFNRTLIRWGNARSPLIDLWFTVGTYTSLVLLPIGITILLIAFFKNFTVSTESSILEPVVPGFNLPLSELGYYSLTLIICSVVHELGHVLSAVRDDVALDSIGINLFFIIPVAYVNISTEKLFSLTKWRTLKILCGGVWHNVALSLGAFLIYLVLPYIFSPFFYVGQGVTIADMTKNSPLHGPKGLFIKDTIIKINNCPVTDLNSYYNCLNIMRQHKSAFCLDSDTIHNLDESIPLKHLENGNLDCCGAKNPKNFCFELIESSNGILELPAHACLPARTVIERSKQLCSREPHSCPEQLYCFRPLLPNATNLYKIELLKKPEVIYVGLVSDIQNTLEISEYIPKRFFSNTVFPDAVKKLSKYITVISLGLGLVNIIPCMYMDGEYVANIVMQMLFLKYLGNGNTKAASLLIVWFFTGLLILHCLYVTWRMIF